MLQTQTNLRSLASFWHCSEASLVPIFAVALVPIVALVGTAVDYSRANNIRSQMQNALDAAVLAGARDDTASWTQAAQNVFNATFQPTGISAASPSFVLNGD